MNKLNNKITAIFFSAILALCLQSHFYGFANEIANTEESIPKLERHFIFDAVPLNLEELGGLADRIFAGICISSEEIENDEETNLPVIKYTFKITEGIKGVEGKEEITFKQWKPTTRTNGYEVDKKYVLFLYPDSSRNLTSAVGVDQGYFNVEKTGLIRRKEVVKNKLNNKGLNRNLKTQKRISIANDEFVNEYVNRCSELGIPIRYKEFIKAVKYLVEKE